MTEQKKYPPHEINLITMALEQKGRKGPGFSADGLGRLSLGTCSLQESYWADRYLKVGFKLKQNEENQREVRMAQPATKAEVAMMIIQLSETELIPLAFAALKAVNTITDALLAKGLLSRDELEEARKAIEKEVDQKLPTEDELKAALTDGAKAFTKDEMTPPEPSEPEDSPQSEPSDE